MAENINKFKEETYIDPEWFDQTAKADSGKPKLSLVPTDAIRAIARVREYGNSKYPEGGKDNWRTVEKERYKDAMYRHMLDYIDDPGSIDEESGLPHLWHIACNIAFLCELEEFDEQDDTLYADGIPRYTSISYTYKGTNHD